ncbi:hypothetical protein Tco_0541233 [Tanacetum coccineum]
MENTTVEEYMTITRINYESGNEKGRIELKGQFLIELCDNAFSRTNAEGSKDKRFAEISEGQSMQRPPLFESDHFIYWKNRFETYVKAEDLDLWHIILNGDFPPVAKNEATQILEVVPFEEQSYDLKKKLAKNNEAKMILYNALPKKEYERIFMCKTTKDIWQSLLITHQEESIDSCFARFNTIITSLKALDEGFSSKNYVRKFLRALHPKWKEKVMVIEESKDLSPLALDELIGNLKVHEVVMEKDSEIYRGKKERIKSIALKAKKESSDDETLKSRSDDEEYVMAKGKSDQKFFRCGDPNHLNSDCPKPSCNKDQKAFIGGSWSDSKNDAEDKTKDETCLTDQSSNKWVSNSLVHSLCALSTLRRSSLRMASTAAKPCQGDSLEFYLITGIPTAVAADKRHIDS